MQIKETHNKDLSRKYEVQFSGKDVSAAVDAQAEKLAKEVKLDGFRKGKVPASVVKKMYKDNIYKDVVDDLIQKAADKIVSDNKLKLAVRPNVELDKFDEKDGLALKIEMEIYPEIEELDFKKFKLTDYKYELDNSEIKEAEDRVLSMHKELTDAKKGTKAKEGDTVLIDFTGYIDGKEFPGGAAKDYKLDLGNGHFIPGFESGLVGAKEGDTKSLKLKFPDDYGSKDHAGKDVEFKVEVKKVMNATLPKMDDEFAKKIKFKDAKELQDQLKNSIERNYDEVKRAVMKKELFDELEKSAKFMLPSQMVEREYDVLVQQMNKAGDESADKKEKEKKEKLYRKIAERRVKLGMLLADIAQRKKIEISNDDINRALGQYLRQMPGQEQAIIDYYKKNPQALESLKGQILEDKVVDHLIDTLEKKEKKIKAKDLIELSKKIDKEFAA